MDSTVATIPRRVRLATLLGFLFHGAFILRAAYRLSYDAYTHMFFADHYSRDWFSLWDARWFGGFDVISYPPLVHQLIGLLGYVGGVDQAYAALQWTVSTSYPLAIYGFSRIFWGRSASSWAALAAAVLPSLFYTAYAFGQLPTLTATLFALFALAALAGFLRSGDKLSGALGIALITVTMASHHATLLFLLCSTGAVAAHIFLNDKLELRIFVWRLFSFCMFAAIGGLAVIWPFWMWGAAQAIQTPIDHLSRHNFFSDPTAFGAFFLPMYGAFAVALPFVLWNGIQRRRIAHTVAFLVLLVLGLGGTTALPRVVFGSGWEWLTYDRFAFWASLLLAPPVGELFINVRRLIPARLWLKVEIARSLSARPLFSFRIPQNLRTAVTLWALAVLWLMSFLAGSVPILFHTQPEAVDMQPIVDFLDEKEHSGWRYLTFGFGDQMAHLSRLTNSTTIDGSYFTARTLPELRQSGIGLIDTAFWSTEGVRALDPILQKSGGHGVRWGFVDRRDYVPELKRHGWVFVKYLKNGIQVWEDPNAVLPKHSRPPAEEPVERLSWGILPLLAFFIVLVLTAFRLSTPHMPLPNIPRSTTARRGQG